jgi:hypothetical protein
MRSVDDDSQSRIDTARGALHPASWVFACCCVMNGEVIDTAVLERGSAVLVVAVVAPWWVSPAAGALRTTRLETPAL